MSIEALETVPASGSCARCGRALGLASAKVDGRWYGNAVCATGARCPLDRREAGAPDGASAGVPEAWLYSRPRRFFRRRRPKELRG